MKTFAITLSSIVGILILGFALNYTSWASYNFFAPKYEATRRATFVESQSYNEGMVRDLENLQMQYEQSNDVQKQALKAIVLHRFSVYNKSQLPPNLYNFYQSLKGY